MSSQKERQWRRFCGSDSITLSAASAQTVTVCTWDPDAEYGSHAETAVSAPATDWFLAEGATGFFDECILSANPNTRAATAAVTHVLTGGGTLVRTIAVPANSRLTIDVNGEAGNGISLANASVSAAVHSDEPIIVERAMYSSSRRVWWATGSDTVATKLR